MNSAVASCTDGPGAGARHAATSANREANGNGGNEKAQAQRGADGFAVGADVNDAPVSINRGKRWRGSPLQLQLTQIVILDHPGLFLSGPVQES